MAKKKKIIILLIAILSLFGVGITYSILSSGANVATNDQNIAKFIFNAEAIDHLNLELIDLKPGDRKDYLFAISNSEDNKISDVTIEYQITIKTFHMAPLVIKLYKIEGGNEAFVLECDETYSRNDHNELVCNVPVSELTHGTSGNDEYKLEVVFPSQYNNIAYAEIIDYINLDIQSWQKTGA